MTEHTSRLSTIQSSVYDFLVEIGDFSDENFFRWLQVAIRGFKNLNMLTLKSYNVAKLTMNANREATLPNDYLNWLEVGYISGDRIIPLGRNPNLFIARDGDYTGAVETSDDSSPVYLFGDIGPTWTPYGAGGVRSSGSFNVDKESGKIRFSTVVPRSTIIMRYISTGIPLTGATMVPTEVGEYLIEWLHWRRKKTDSKATRGQVMDAKQDFLEAENLISEFQQEVTYNEIVDIFYGSSGQSAKR